ncbi:MAG: hypothetical protein R3314_07720, partial [Longimicrobiales bacterium]|nr:hypothetical protein [Longimicrobiales bacterium]
MTAPVKPAPGDRAVLVHGDRFDAGVASAVEAEGVRVRPAPEIPADLDADAPTVLVLDAGHVEAAGDAAAALDAVPTTVVVVTLGDAAERAASGHDRYFMALPAAGREATLRALQAAFRHAVARQGRARIEAELGRSRDELQELSQIGMALMTERDPDRLLDKILDRAMA